MIGNHLKPGGFKLWVNCCIQRAEPALPRMICSDSLAVALQVAFERQNLKPAFHLICYRLWV
jgi:hypothetical protein